MTHSFTFNSVDFGDYGLKVTSAGISPYRFKSSLIQLQDLAYGSQPVRESKIIWPQFTVSAGSRSALDDYLDFIKMTLDEESEKALKFDILSDRYWNARVIRAFDGRYISPCDFEGAVQFECSDPLAFGTTARSNAHAIAADPTTVTETTVGSARIRPTYTLLATAALGAITVKVTNTDTGEEWQWQGTFADTKQLVFNTTTWVVTYDGAADMATVSGQPPSLLPSTANPIKITGVSSATLTISYRDRYL